MQKIKHIRTGLRLWLQLEQYNPRRFLNLIYKDHFYLQWPFRQKVDWTNKMKAVAFLSICLFLIDVFLWYILAWLISIHSWIAASIIILLSILLFPFYIVLSVRLLTPVDQYLKNKTIHKAKKKLSSLKAWWLKVIGVTGSYGKTSMKNILTHTLNGWCNAITSEWTLNTPMWISTTILQKLDENIDVFVVEMWAFLPWDIKMLCELVDPDMWIITWITKQHLERMWSIENIARTKWELWDYLIKRQRPITVNLMNQETVDALSSAWISLESSYISKVEYMPPVTYIQNFEWIQFSIITEKWNVPEKEIQISVSSLAAYNAEYCLISFLLWGKLWIEKDKMIQQFSTLPQVKHRLELIRNTQTWVTIIDDSFNGNIAWVRATNKLISSQTISWKKIYLTPWLVELGDESEEVHRMLAKELVGVYDLFLFVDTFWTQIYKEELIHEWIWQKSIYTYATAKEAHDSLSDHLQSWDVIVFQNDATDNYS